MARPVRSRSPRLEALEDRYALSTLTVTSGASRGRYATLSNMLPAVTRFFWQLARSC
jgi:hypothetical protein